MEEENQTPFYLFFATDRIPITSKVSIRWLIDDKQKPSLEVVIDADTTVDDIIKAWYIISEERNELNTHLGNSVAGYLRCLMIMHQDEGYAEIKFTDSGNDVDETPDDGLSMRKPSPQDLAAEVNFDLLLYVLHVYYKRPDTNIADALFKGMLSEFGFDEENSDHYLQEAFEELSLDRCPWDIYDKPITREKMREMIRYRQKKHGSILIPPAYKLSDLRMFYLRELFEAKRLLAKTYPKAYKRYEPRFWAMFDEIQEARYKLRSQGTEAK